MHNRGTEYPFDSKKSYSTHRQCFSPFRPPYCEDRHKTARPVLVRCRTSRVWTGRQRVPWVRVGKYHLPLAICGSATVMTGRATDCSRGTFQRRFWKYFVRHNHVQFLCCNTRLHRKVVSSTVTPGCFWHSGGVRLGRTMTPESRSYRTKSGFPIIHGETDGKREVLALSCDHIHGISLGVKTS